MEIAIFAYGSMINNFSSPFYEGILEVNGPFLEVGLEILTAFHFLGSKECKDSIRACLVPFAKKTKITSLTPVFYATHKSKNLEDAIQNVLSREGTDDPQDLALFFNPKLVHKSNYRENSFNQETVTYIHQWLKKTSYDVILMVQLAPNATIEEIRELFKGNEGSQTRTKTYYKNLPLTSKKVHKNPLELLGLEDLENL